MIYAAAQAGKLFAELVTGQPRPEVLGVLDRSKKAQGAVDIVGPNRAVHDSAYSAASHRTAELKTVEKGNPQQPVDAINEINRVGKTIVGALDASAIGKIPPLKTSLVFPQTFVFQFPYRKNQRQDWSLHQYVMLKGTRVTYTVTYGAPDPKGDYGIESEDLKKMVQRNVRLEFNGGSDLNGGFWGPFQGKMKKGEPFPELRVDKLTVIELFNKKTGEPVPFHEIKDYSGDDQVVPYKVVLVLSEHDVETGELSGCSILGIFVGASCIKVDGGKAYEMDMSRKIYSIFKNMASLRIRSEPKGGVVVEADSFYERVFGKKVKNANSLKSVGLSLMMWYLWREGAKLATYQVDHFPRIGKMEEKL